MKNEIKNILEEIEDYSKHEYLPPCCELTNEACKQLLDYITNLQEEIKRLNGALNQADNKNLELIEMINKIYDIIENDNITGIEARLTIQDILDKENK